MQTDQIFLILETVATAAIVVSLLFLAFEQRRTRQQAELANWRDVLQALTDYKGRAADPALAALLVRGHSDYHALAPAERLAFDMYMEQGIHIIGNFLKHNEALPRKLRGLEEALVNTVHEMLTTPGGAEWWQEAQERGRFMAQTYTVMNDLLARRARTGTPLFA